MIDHRGAQEPFRERLNPDGPSALLLRSPELMSRTQKVGEYLRFNSPLPPRLNEFAILITARQWGAQVEWIAHYLLAVKAGLAPEVAADLAQGKRPTGMIDLDCAYLTMNENVKIPKALVKGINRVTAQVGVMPGALVKTALANQLDYEARFLKAVDEGIADLGAGRTFSTRVITPLHFRLEFVVGPTDMTRALGITGQPNHPKLVAVMERVAEAVRKSNNARLSLTTGYALFPRTIRQLRDMGVSYTNVAPSPDVRLLKSLSQNVADLRKELA
jgi:hypothetical protein